MNWPQLAYEYLIGGAFFAVTLWLCFQKGGAEKKNRSDHRTMTVCIAGLLGYLLVHIGWIVAATL